MTEKEQDEAHQLLRSWLEYSKDEDAPAGVDDATTTRRRLHSRTADFLATVSTPPPELTSAPVDTFNRFFVQARGAHVTIISLPVRPMSHEEALGLAAWLVALTGQKARFREILRAVETKT